MTTLENVGFDVHLRHTNTDGKSYVQSHRVWNKDRFMVANEQAVAKLNAERKPGESRKAKVEQITEEQYMKERA